MRARSNSGTAGMVANRFLLALGAVLACGDGGDSGAGSDQGEVSPFAKTSTSIDIEVDYVEGAAPYTGTLGSARATQVWDIGRENLSALFPHKTIRLPTTLTEMQLLPATGSQSYTTHEILELASEHWDQPESPGVARYYVIWLDGWLEQDDAIQESVLGISLGGTQVLAIFKPALRILEQSGFPVLPEFVEQSTLVHEFGHAIGLVGTGIAPTSPHADPAHVGHCSNPRCVMYHLNEGPLDLRDFAREFVRTGDMVLFDSACLADVAAATE
jgi:hypothetical protein